MRMDRAKEIVESTGVIDVHYQGRPVWIEGLEDGKAVVSFLHDRDRHLVVPVADLVEQP